MYVVKREFLRICANRGDLSPRSSVDEAAKSWPQEVDCHRAWQGWTTGPVDFGEGAGRKEVVKASAPREEEEKTEPLKSHSLLVKLLYLVSLSMGLKLQQCYMLCADVHLMVRFSWKLLTFSEVDKSSDLLCAYAYTHLERTEDCVTSSGPQNNLTSSSII